MSSKSLPNDDNQPIAADALKASDQKISHGPAPVTSGERIDALDTVRGVATLGILAMNIIIMGNVFALLANPTILGPATSLDLSLWFGTSLLMEGTMRTIFGMLFGAGVYLFFSRIEEREGKKRARNLHLRRTFFLMLFGLADAFLLLWLGDILFLYGLMGLFIWLFRHTRTGWLLFAITLFFLIGLALKAGNAWQTDFLDQQKERIVALQDKGSPLSDEDQELLKAIKDNETFGVPSEEDARKQQKAVAKGYASAADTYRPITVMLLFVIPFLFMIWDSGITMLLGVLLFKKGFFEGKLTTRSYALFMVFGYAIGLGLRAMHLLEYQAAGFDHSVYNWNQLWYDIERVGIAFGHLGLLMLLIKGGVMPLKDRLAAVGRMALSNYLMHSVIALVIFILLGFYGAFGRTELMLIMVAIWALQLIISPLWLARFRFGPAEWLWRSLTYWSPQPLRRS